MNYNFFTDFVALTSIAGIEKSFSEKKKAEKSQVEKNTAEKKCECKCKNQQDFHKELLGQFEECKKILGKGPSAETSMHFISTFLGIEKRLRAEIEKTDTKNSCQYAESQSYWILKKDDDMCKDDDENFIANLLKNHKFHVCGDGSEANEKFAEASEKSIRDDEIIYLPKTEKEKIIKLIYKCLGIIQQSYDEDFIIVKEHLCDILCTLRQYK